MAAKLYVGNLPYSATEDGLKTHFSSAGSVASVKIIIDRKVKKGKESEFSKLIRELRGKAISSKGYVSGETLRAMDDPNNYIVIEFDAKQLNQESFKTLTQFPEIIEASGEEGEFELDIFNISIIYSRWLYEAMMT